MTDPAKCMHMHPTWDVKKGEIFCDDCGMMLSNDPMRVDGINYDLVNRWENGIEHHPESEKLYKRLAELDYHYNQDGFCFKSGGDGDNGESLMYLLDMYFDEFKLLNNVPPKVIRNSEFILDKEKYTLYLKRIQQYVILPRYEFEFLFLLASSPDKIFTEEELLDKIWHGGDHIGSNTIVAHVSKLKKKLGSNTIKNVRTVGYKYSSE